MSDEREVTVWDKPLPRMEFTTSFNIKRKKNEDEVKFERENPTKESPYASVKSHSVTMVLVAEGVTPKALAEVCAKHRNVALQNGNRCETDAEMEAEAKALNGQVRQLLSEGKSEGKGKTAEKIAEAVKNERTLLDKKMALALEHKTAAAIDFVEYGPTVRLMLEAAGVTFTE